VCEILRKFDINSLYSCPPYLYTVATSHFTLRNPKSHFSTVLLIHTSDFLHYLRRNKLQLLYCSLSVYLGLTIVYCWLLSILYISHIVWPVFSERELKFMFAICHRPSVCLSSVCRLSSVTLVHPTQAIEIFGNVSMPCGTLAIRDLCIKILRRSSQGNPSGGG